MLLHGPQVDRVELKKSSCVDNLIDSQPSKPDALEIALETENMLAKGGFAVKCWQFSGESSPRVGNTLYTSNDMVTTIDGSVLH